MIYCIGNREQGFCKIGYTAADAGRRCCELQTGNPYQLTVFGVLPGETADEQSLHIQFAELRMIGEWFRLTDEIVGLFAPYTNHRKREKEHVVPIMQFDLQGNPLQTFRSVLAASEATGIFTAPIIRCCQHKVRRAGEYRWMYARDYHAGKRLSATMRRHGRCKSVAQYTPEGALVAVFPDAHTAAEAVGLDRRTIGAAVRGLKNWAGGYLWRFVDADGVEAQIEPPRRRVRRSREHLRDHPALVFSY